MSDHDNDIDGLLCWLSSPPAHDWDEKPSKQDRYYLALAALVAERDELQSKVKEHAEDRRKYIDAWADWIEANAGLEIGQWLRVYADAVPIPSLDGDEAKERVFKHLDQRMRDAADMIAALFAERNALRDELERERMRLAACGVAAMANTRETAADARACAPEYRSASFDDVCRIVDSEMSLRDRIAELEAASKPADLDLRERNDTMVRWMNQVTKMLFQSMTHSHDARQELVNRNGAAIIAMRKGESDAR